MQSEIKTPEDLIYDLYLRLYLDKKWLEPKTFVCGFEEKCVRFQTFAEFVTYPAPIGLGHSHSDLDNYVKSRDSDFHWEMVNYPQDPAEIYCVDFPEECPEFEKREWTDIKKQELTRRPLSYYEKLDRIIKR